MNLIKAVIFDMDGVIFDSERASCECWVRVMNSRGYRGAEEIYPRLIGVNTRLGKQIIMDHYGPDFPYDDILLERRAVFDSKYSNGRLPVKEGARQLLALLREKGFPVALASSTARDRVESQLKSAGLLDFFDVIIGGDMVTKSKPDPEIFLKAADALGFEPSDCAIIEDSHNGIRAAFGSGALPIMVPDMLPATDEMKEKAAVVLESLNDVWNYLKDKTEVKMDINTFYKSVLDQDNAPVVICDLSHTILYMNPAAAERYRHAGGYGLVGKSVMDCHHQEGQSLIIKVLDWFKKSPENNVVYTDYNPKENKDVYMVAMRDENKELIGYYEKHCVRNRETSSKYSQLMK